MPVRGADPHIHAPFRPFALQVVWAAWARVYLYRKDLRAAPPHFQRFDSDPNPVAIDFQFGRFSALAPEQYASDHCPVLLDVP
jgi:hypothetical protein